MYHAWPPEKTAGNESSESDEEWTPKPLGKFHRMVTLYCNETILCSHMKKTSSKNIAVYKCCLDFANVYPSV